MSAPHPKKPSVSPPVAAPRQPRWLRRAIVAAVGLTLVWGMALLGTSWLVHHRLSQRRLVAADANDRLATWLRLGRVDWSTRLTLDRKLGRTDSWDRDEPLIRAAGITRRRLEHERILIAAQSGGLEHPEAALAELIRGEQVDGRDIFEAFTNGAVANYQVEEALYLLDSWDRDYPDDPLPCLIRGRIAEHRNDWDDAVRRYTAALQRDSSFGPAAYNLARVQLGRARLDAALQSYRSAAALLELPAPAFVGMAHCLRLSNQLDAAETELNRVLPLSKAERILAWRIVGDTADSAVATPLMERGEICLARKQPLPAVASFEEALREQPWNSSIRFHLAAALRQAGRTADAEREYALVKQAREALAGLNLLLERVRAEPENPALRTELGNLFLKHISPKQGSVWLHSALRVDPGDAPAHESLARFYDGLSPATPETRQLAADHRRRAGLPEAASTLPAVIAAAPVGVDRPSPAPTAAATLRARDPERPNTPSQPRPQRPSASFRFPDVAAASGIDFTYRNGEQAEQDTIVESIGGGVGWFDFDLDGRLDLVFPGGGEFPRKGELSALPTGLFRQVDDWRFQPVATLAAFDRPAHFTHGVAIGDVDSDGFPDLFITGYGGTTFYRNLGDGTFVDETRSSGLFDPRFSTSAAWGDLNGDGFPELYVAHYVDWSWSNNPRCFGPGNIPDVCPPRQFQGLDDRLFVNNADGTFRDVSQGSGLLPQGKGLGVLIADPDLDGDSDIYVANDTTENRYYVNLATAAGPIQPSPTPASPRFREDGLIQGVALDDRAVANGSMGVDLGDYDLDGRPDLWVANYEQELFALYHNEGALGFQYASRQAGISELGELFVGFGTSFGDFDLDGDEDLIVANGHVIQTQRLSPIRQLPLLLENQSGRFHRSSFSPGTYLGSPHLGRGLSVADADRDGDLDFAVSHNNEPVAVLRNETSVPGRAVVLRVIGTRSNRDAVGTLLEWTISDQKFTSQVTGGGSYLSASPSDQLLVWPAGTEHLPADITIRWPSGLVEKLRLEPKATRLVDLIEGRSVAGTSLDSET